MKHAATRGTGEFERNVLQRDGELLIEAFKRQADRDGQKERQGQSGPDSLPRSYLTAEAFPEA